MAQSQEGAAFSDVPQTMPSHLLEDFEVVVQLREGAAFFGVPHTMSNELLEDCPATEVHPALMPELGCAYWPQVGYGRLRGPDIGVEWMEEESQVVLSHDRYREQEENLRVYGQGLAQRQILNSADAG